MELGKETTSQEKYEMDQEQILEAGKEQKLDIQRWTAKT
jgi:hypothetical protein